MRFTNLPLLDRVAPRGPGWRRHVPPVLFLPCWRCWSSASPGRRTRCGCPGNAPPSWSRWTCPCRCRPTTSTPTGSAAAKAAAQEFVDDLPDQFNVGLVAFAGTAAVVVPPTTDREAVTTAIGNLTTRAGTAIGEAVFSSLDAVRSFDQRGGRPTRRRPRIVLLSDGDNTSGRWVADAMRRP